MANQVEALCKGPSYGRGMRRWYKACTARKARRLSKRFMEDAPPRCTKGYAD